MLNRRLLAVLLVVMSLTLGAPCVAQPSSAEREILDLEEKMDAAYAANDLPTYFAYYADDFTQWLTEGRTDLPQYKKEWTEFIHSGGKIESDQISDMHMQVNPAGDTVVASYLLHVRTRSPKGKVSDEDFQESDVWFKRDGVWKVVHLHSLLPPRKSDSRHPSGDF